jgi:hypothetical protein
MVVHYAGKVYPTQPQSQAINTHMNRKSFKQFLENYDVYLDKPIGFKKPEDTEPAEEETDESVAQEENANEVRK